MKTSANHTDIPINKGFTDSQAGGHSVLGVKRDSRTWPLSMWVAQTNIGLAQRINALSDGSLDGAHFEANVTQGLASDLQHLTAPVSSP